MLRAFEYASERLFAGGEANPSVVNADTTSIGSASWHGAFADASNQESSHPPEATSPGVANRSVALRLARSFGRTAGATLRRQRLAQAHRTNGTGRARASALGQSPADRAPLNRAPLQRAPPASND